MTEHSNPADYKPQLASTFDSRLNYDDEYTVSRALKLVDLAQLQPGQSVLDLATGTGLAAIPAAEIVGNRGRIVGVDISQGMLDQARMKVRAAGLRNVELSQGDVEQLDFASESFDAILCSSSLMWMTDIPATLSRCLTWLKRGGLLAFSCYSETSFMIPHLVNACAKFGVTLPHCNEPLGTPERCRVLVEAAGFHNVEVQTEQFGSYLDRDDPWWEWDANWIHPRGNPLADLSRKRLGEIKAAYNAEIDALKTEHGYWLEITMFLVTARKP